MNLKLKRLLWHATGCLPVNYKELIQENSSNGIDLFSVFQEEEIFTLTADKLVENNDSLVELFDEVNDYDAKFVTNYIDKLTSHRIIELSNHCKYPAVFYGLLNSIRDKKVSSAEYDIISRAHKGEVYAAKWLASNKCEDIEKLIAKNEVNANTYINYWKGGNEEFALEMFKRSQNMKVFNQILENPEDFINASNVKPIVPKNLNIVSANLCKLMPNEQKEAFISDMGITDESENAVMLYYLGKPDGVDPRGLLLWHNKEHHNLHKTIEEAKELHLNAKNPVILIQSLCKRL